MKKFKKWNVIMLVMVLLVFAFIAFVNIKVDPFGYFTFQSGDYADIDFQADTTYYQRLLKVRHVENFGENYDAYLIGGSKAGSYLPETLSNMDGYRYFNMFELGGNFYEYEQTIDFLLKEASPKKIVLSISGGEIRQYQKDKDDLTFKMPADVTGESKLKELMEFLFLDLHKSKERLEERNGGKQYFELKSDGSRNIEKYYTKFAEDPVAFTNQYVLQKLDTHLSTLFTTNIERDYYQDCLDALQRIKNNCDAAGVELQVIVAPAFIGEMSEHDTSYYRAYLLNMAGITDYWDFSGYHDINLNPYNYYNEGHFFYETANLVINTIAGTDSYPGFGFYVTQTNAATHVAEREADYERLQAEYNSTGTIQLPGMDNASYLLGRE